MTIDRVSSTAALVAALRAEMARKSERSRGQTAAGAQRNQGARAAARHDPAALRRELADLVKGVAPDDPEAVAAVRPRVVRAVLLWEFGAELREHPEWQPMLDTLVDTLQADERHRDAFVQMIRDLQR